MILKLSPARRVLFVVVLVLLVFPGFDFRYREAEIQIPNLSFLRAIALLIVVLANLEMPDKLRIVILPSTRVRAYAFGAVRDSFGIIPKSGGATS